jgi:uncharacterized protein
MTKQDDLDAHLAPLRAIARSRCEGADSAHDWLHVERVTATARRIAAAEGANVRITTAAALLHELFNLPKNHPEAHRSGELCAAQARVVLVAQGWSEADMEAVCHAIHVHPFSLGVVPDTLEAKILQDADRLDAIGAVGVARCFATCAAMQRPFYDPDDPRAERRAHDDKRWGVDHFYQKLLRLETRMHTATARAIAARRTRFLRDFLEQFFEEVCPIGDPFPRDLTVG